MSEVNEGFVAYWRWRAWEIDVAVSVWPGLVHAGVSLPPDSPCRRKHVWFFLGVVWLYYGGTLPRVR